MMDRKFFLPIKKLIPEKWQPRLGRFYKFYQKYSQLIFFLGGFAWDSLTLTRIDRLSDNLILLLYLILLGMNFLLLNLDQQGQLNHPLLKKYSHWYPLAAQFFLGGLFSSYVVFYFQSASFTQTMIFLLLLVVLLVANEFLEHRLSNFYLQSALYFFAILSFFIFFLPVITREMNRFIFVLSGIFSLLFACVFLYLLYRKFFLITIVQLERTIGIILSIYLIVNVFYTQNWIPPVPLSMKDGGIYHQVKRQGNLYRLKMVQPAWYQFHKTDDDPYFYQPGDSVFCFTSVFAPVKLTKNILHRWQYWDEKTEKWITTDVLGFEIRGGRRGGYRGYTYKKNVQEGNWRVDVITAENLLLGRITFRIVPADQPIRKWKFLYK